MHRAVKAAPFVLPGLLSYWMSEEFSVSCFLSSEELSEEFSRSFRTHRGTTKFAIQYIKSITALVWNRTEKSPELGGEVAARKGAADVALVGTHNILFRLCIQRNPQVAGSFLLRWESHSSFVELIRGFKSLYGNIETDGHRELVPFILQVSSSY